MTTLNSLKVTHSDDVEVYRWESAFGPGPYRFQGCTEEKYQACHGAPIQPGTTCDYCGQGIMYAAWWTTPAGVRFKTGLDCAEKSGKKDVIGAVRKAKRELAAAKRAARAARRKEELTEALSFDVVQQKLAALPHPNTYHAEKGLTLLDWCQWMLTNAGDKGRMEALKTLKATCKIV